MALAVCLSGTASAVFAQSPVASGPLPVLKADGKTLKIRTSTSRNADTWTIEPSLRPDVFETQARQVTFMSGIDTIRFSLDEGQVSDFVALTASGDSAYIQVERVSDNPLENPPRSMVRRSGSGKLSKKQAIFDIEALLYTLSEVHPNMFFQCPQSKFFDAVAEAKSRLGDSVSVAELYRLMAPIVGMIGDGHTRLYFPLNNLVASGATFMPMLVDVMPDSSVVVRSSQDGAVPQGASVLSINGVEAGDMVADMMRYESGERYFFRIEGVNSDFPGLLSLLYPADAYVVRYRPKDGGAVREATLRPVAFSVLSEMPGRRKSSARRPAYSFRVDKASGVAVMDFHSFSNPRRMSAFADSMFTVLRNEGISNLIIDLRHNGGGNSAVGDTLLRYISPKPFIQFSKTIMRITPTTKRLARLGNIPPGWRCLPVSGALSMNKPRTAADGHYDGNVYLLTSHHTFSSAASFSWAFSSFDMGTVVGEETGGMNVCYGDVVSYRLPASGLNCQISWKRFWSYGADENYIHGTLPDCPVKAAEALDKALDLAGRCGRHKLK